MRQRHLATVSSARGPWFVRTSLVAAIALAPGLAAASGYSVAVFRGAAFNGHSLGMTGDGINASGNIVGEGAVDFTVNGQLEGDTHGLLVRAGALVGTARVRASERSQLRRVRANARWSRQNVSSRRPITILIHHELRSP